MQDSATKPQKLQPESLARFLLVSVRLRLLIGQISKGRGSQRIAPARSQWHDVCHEDDASMAGIPRSNTNVCQGRFLLAAVAVAAWTLGSAAHAGAQTQSEMDIARKAMVQKFVIGMGIENERVIGAMRTTHREYFVSRRFRRQAYYDQALPIGGQQTISSPFIVAFMTEQLDPKPEDSVLEIGTGSGYQAAVLSALVKDIYTIEIVPELARKAQRTLKRYHYDNVHVKIGDGFQGWPEHAPFDKIVVTCSPENIPQPLVEQLAEGGRIVIPVGQRYQQMMYVGEKKNGRVVTEGLRPTLFVPMTGDAEQRREVQPDPTNPTVVNGGFEDISDENHLPLVWFYQRQMVVVQDDHAPEGKRFARFFNVDAGRPSRAMQGIGVDGYVVKELDIALQVKTNNVLFGEHRDQKPVLAVTYFDENQIALSDSVLGPWRGTHDWHKFLTPEELTALLKDAGLTVTDTPGSGRPDVFKSPARHAMRSCASDYSEQPASCSLTVSRSARRNGTGSWAIRAEVVNLLDWRHESVSGTALAAGFTEGICPFHHRWLAPSRSPQ